MRWNRSSEPEGKIVVATFSSSLYRLKIVVALAARSMQGGVCRRGMNETAVAQRLGFLHVRRCVALGHGVQNSRSGRRLPGKRSQGETTRRCRGSRSTITGRYSSKRAIVW